LNEDIEKAIDLPSLVSYDPDKDDKRFYIDEKEGYKIYPSKVDRRHHGRTSLKVKVFEDQDIFILILGPNESEKSSENDKEDAKGIIQIYCLTSLNLISEVKILSDPTPEVYNSYHFKVFLTVNETCALIALNLKDKLFLCTLNRGKTEWTETAWLEMKINLNSSLECAHANLTV
jgi:hypothetical protein